MLKQHKYYLYYEGSSVYARMEDRDRVLVEECKTPQEAHDRVQAIINPGKRSFDSFGPLGFNSSEFKGAISDNCKAVVEAAYKKH